MRIPFTRDWFVWTWGGVDEISFGVSWDWPLQMVVFAFWRWRLSFGYDAIKRIQRIVFGGQL